PHVRFLFLLRTSSPHLAHPPFPLLLPSHPFAALFPYTTLFRSFRRRPASDDGIRTRSPRRLPRRSQIVLAALPRALTFLERQIRSKEHTSELQSPYDLVCRLLLEKKKKKKIPSTT